MVVQTNRSLSEQSLDELGGAGSVLARQKQDHAQLESLLRSLELASGAEQDELLTRICRLVFRHAFAEEAVLWPVVRRVLPDGESLTLRIEREHQEINELTSRLETMSASDPARPRLVRQIVDLLRQDVRDEEDVLLPQLQQALSVDELRRLGRSWEVVRRAAPTRPHPSVARRPPGNALAALPLTVLDNGRDGVDRAARRLRTLAPALRLVSRGLATAAGAVEQLPVLRRGERPETRSTQKEMQ